MHAHQDQAVRAAGLEPVIDDVLSVDSIRIYKPDPQVYEIATTLISHSEGRIDRDIIDRALESFQRVSPLSIGELWALPAMFRLALIESVRRMALRTVQRLEETDLADHWAGRIEAASESRDEDFRAILREFVSDAPPLTAIFVTRFLHQIHLSRASYPPLEVLERWIAEEGMTTPVTFRAVPTATCACIPILSTPSGLVTS